MAGTSRGDAGEGEDRSPPIVGANLVQAGAFSMRVNAEGLQARFAPLGSVQVMTASIKGIEIYRVRLGLLASVEEADQLLARVVDSGYPQARIVVD